MKALLMACVAAVLCVDVANSLSCYTCANQTSNDQCMTSTPCTKNEAACATTVQEIRVGTEQRNLINKMCISNCGALHIYYKCCLQDNCNFNKASGMTPPTVVLGTTVLVSVTRFLLWTGL